MGILGNVRSLFLRSTGGVSAIAENESKALSSIHPLPLTNDGSSLVGMGPIPTKTFSGEVAWGYVKSSPEIVAVLTAVTDDIISDGWIFKGSESAVKKAEDFAHKVKLKSLTNTLVWDALVTGDGYLYKLQVSPDVIDKAIKISLAKLPDDYDNDFIEMVEKKLDQLQPTLYGISNLVVLPSSTMEIKYDIHGIPIYYQQSVDTLPGNERTVQFKPEEIIHWKPYDLDGKVYGFTPIRAMFKELEILNLIKSVAIRGFSGYPTPRVYILENGAPGDQNYLNLKKSLEDSRNPNNRHKSIILTGKVTLDNAEPELRDMEYRELAEYITRVIIMTWNVPPSRLSNVVGNDKQTMGTTTSEGYYRRISHIQDMLEDMLNDGVFKQFNVKIKFNRTYKQDEVREVQIEKMKTDICEQRLKLGLVTSDWAFDYLQIPFEFRGTGEPDPIKTGLNNQGELNNHQVMTESPDKMAQDAEKQKIQLDKK